MAAWHRLSVDIPDETYQWLKEREQRTGRGTIKDIVITALDTYRFASYASEVPEEVARRERREFEAKMAAVRAENRFQEGN